MRQAHHTNFCRCYSGPAGLFVSEFPGHADEWISSIPRGWTLWKLSRNASAGFDLLCDALLGDILQHTVDIGAIYVSRATQSRSEHNP